ncbi:MAG: molybdopterin-synthase adenylyltransferase MoeB [Pseudobdellovibrio sp.]
MKSSIQNRINFLNKTIPSIDSITLKSKLETIILIDIREDSELLDGIIPTAISVSKGMLELRISDLVPSYDKEIVLYCAGGTRSVFAAASLIEMGFSKVSSLSGGIKAWKDSGLILAQSTMPNLLYKQRYITQIRLPQVGDFGQKKLSNAKVLIIGAGGLGSPVAYYLAAAGIGTIGIIDDDVVDLSNLQRQILHTTDRVGIPKVESAQMTLKNLNPSIQINAYNTRLSINNIDSIIPEYEIIIDGCDNFETRYLVNDACLKHKKINIHGSVFWFEGQASVFCAPNGPCYRCLYPEPPTKDMSANCAEAGVLGVLPGAIGLIQATEAIKLILGIGNSLIGRLLVYDSLQMEFRELIIKKDSNCLVCNNIEDIKYQSYTEHCKART